MIAEAAGVAPEKLATLRPEALLDVQDVPLAAMEADPGAWTTPEAITAFSPTIDGVTVVDKPWLALRSGVASGIDLISGYTRDEFSLWSFQRGLLKPSPMAIAKSLPMLVAMARSRPRADKSAPKPPRAPRARRGRVDLARVAEVLGLADTAPADYRAGYPGRSAGELYTAMYSDSLFRMPSTWLAEEHAAAGGRAFVYEFAWPSPVLGGVLGAVHTIDIPVTFGHAQGGSGVFLFGGKPLSPDFHQVSEHLRSAWISFAGTGDPGWPQFTADDPQARIWDVEPSVVRDPLAASRRIWRPLSAR
jgi:para-nitrobenzyl esterase